MNKFILWLLPISFLLLMAACGNNEQHEDGKMVIYTTVYPLQYFAERIGGEDTIAKSVYPPGSDEHTFEPSQKDMMNLADADLFLYIGYDLEGFAKKAETTLKNEHVKMEAVGEKISLEHDEDEHNDHDGHDHGGINPHLWIDPIYAKEMAEQILNNLVELQPDQKVKFEKNYQELAEELDSLNEDFIKMAESSKRKEFVVAHAAYSYWETRYGLEQIAIAGISSSEEPSQKKLQEIVETINEKNIPYILVEQNINSRLAGVLQKESNTNILHIHNLAVLTDDDIKNNETYFSLMKKNINTLQEALN
ncbi:metal ABC transporter solute-binding protein, Zn/Mn family [Bacillus niameyensis]|uniref:metal ABC transporter solute-binding protein, Zn/Mn family n=1 Tax=Bacillus niameyensis TaxID=1522308 RepID=UPI0007845F95|nr:zinc ABC transporter substrate-binding protein [Bacillus niameyensis]